MGSTYDIRKVLGLIFLVALVVAGSAGAAFAISSMADKTYTAEAQIVVSAGLGTTTNGDVLTAPRIGQTYASLALTRPVLLDVIRRADLPYDTVELARSLRVSADPASPFIVIAATDGSPSRAERTANALADILVKRASDSTTPGSPGQSILEIVERAVVPIDPSGPRVMFNTVLAAATALVLALAIVALLGYLGSERPAEQTTKG